MARPSLLVAIGVGGFLGAIMRYLVSGWVQDWSRSVSFPYGTVAVNLLGAFLLGFLAYLGEQYRVFSPEARALVLVGFLGAFTTFSTFEWETFNLFHDGETLAGVLYAGGQVFLGFLAVWMGRVLAAAVWR
ncbi:MAG: fluoride efflux transporter CrcB [Chloroflexi bacterium]|nr:fluoride efflux transporter CrcB [Chloroflexota bacterium]